ncbi:GFA family protein [Aestuariivirga sp.]|uniref:GFA family protein n=1 Tax=Aestuariivirga sp. TaxID=2650926 RepID=UPI0039E3D5BC
MTEREAITGGCQCGAVRYRIKGPLFGGHICHCRMCQKAFGNFFAALVGVKKTDIAWPKGEPAVFRSSAITSRGYCVSCGTPLTFAYDHTPHMSVSIGSLDHPELAKVENQFGMEGTVPAFATLHDLPGTRTEDDVSPEDMKKLRSLQHPDHD